MVWFHVDPNLANHIKADEAGNAALGLWVRCGAWSVASLTDGQIPPRIAHRFGTQSQIDRLLKAGLWNKTNDGYIFHEWDQRQYSASNIKSRRETERQKKRDQRKQENVPQGHSPPPVPQGVPPDTPDHLSGGTPPGTLPRVFNNNSDGGYVGGETNVSSGAAPENYPPQQFCSKHMPDGTDGDCAACGAARREHASWLAKQTLDAKRQAQAQARDEQAVRHQAIGDCALCDDDGYRLKSPGQPCDHIDRTHTTRRGRQAVNEAMGWT